MNPSIPGLSDPTGNMELLLPSCCSLLVCLGLIFFVCLANLSQSTCEGQRTALVVGYFLLPAEPDPMLYRVNISGQLTPESSITFSVLTSHLGVGVLCRAVVGDTLSAND